MARVAILIDGDNVSSGHAARITALAAAQGRVDVHRAYVNAANGSGWSGVAGVELLHAGTGKNAADLLLSIDAMELALTGGFDTFLLASSDSDFTHLAFRLRKRGAVVIGMGEAKASAAFRAACTRFESLAPAKPAATAATGPAEPGVTDLDTRIRAVIAQHSRKGAGIRLAELNQYMRQKHDIRISQRPERTWRAYLGARPALYEVDPRGPEAHVRFRPSGFA